MYFEQNNIEIIDLVDARKQRIDEEKAWELILSRKKVYIGKGKKRLEFEPGTENKQEILKASMGRSKNLRAPTVQTKDAVLIGFNENIYESINA